MENIAKNLCLKQEIYVLKIFSWEKPVLINSTDEADISYWWKKTKTGVIIKICKLFNQY